MGHIIYQKHQTSSVCCYESPAYVATKCPCHNQTFNNGNTSVKTPSSRMDLSVETAFQIVNIDSVKLAYYSGPLEQIRQNMFYAFTAIRGCM